MTIWPANLGWRPQLDNPNFCGWSVVAAYVLASAFCARAARSRRKMGPEERRFSAIWLFLALGLLFLGINKQLNLQTLLIDLGRLAATAGGWYDKRKVRGAQLIFSAVFTLATVVALWALLARCRRFFVLNPWAAAGVVLLALFVLIRAASINHVFDRTREEGKDKQWTWCLEIAASACLALAAAKSGGPTRSSRSL